MSDAKLPGTSKLEIDPAQGKPQEGNEEVEPYHPFEHRTVEKRVSDGGSLANFVKSAVGTGLFAIPNAFACVGMVLGIIGTLVLGLLITISLHLLMRTHYMTCQRVRKPYLTYDKLVSLTLTVGVSQRRLSPELITLFVDIVMLSCYIGIGAVYVVFVAGIVQESVDMEKTIDQAYYSIIIFPVLLLMNLIRKLNSFAPISLLANALLFIAAIVGIIYAFREGKGNWVYIETNVSDYPKFIGTVFFSMCSPGLILAIEHNMINPWNYTKFPGVLNWGMIFLVCTHVIVGAIVYSRWGADSLGNFIRNHKEHDAGTFSVLIMQGIAIYLSYGLQCYMPISILTNDYAIPSIKDKICRGSPFLWELIVRFGVTAVTCTLAAAVPQLHLFTSLVGALCIASLGTIVPAILYLISYYGNFGRYYWRLTIAVLILLIGTFAMACGTISSGILIIKYLKYG